MALIIELGAFYLCTVVIRELGSVGNSHDISVSSDQKMTQKSKVTAFDK